jgi:thiamine-phosphate pyrophosphorylase
LPAVAEATRSGAPPVLAIGGMTVERVETVRRHGARGVAVVSAILEAADPRAAAAALRARCGA